MAKAPTDRKFAITREFAAPIEDVFDAWRDPDAMAEWMSSNPSARSRVKVDFRVGGTFSIDMASRGSMHTGRYLSIDPPTGLSFTWRSPNTQDRDTFVSITLRALGPACTEITLEHWGFVEDAMVPMHTRGWTQLLAQLEPQLARASHGVQSAH